MLLKTCAILRHNLVKSFETLSKTNILHLTDILIYQFSEAVLWGASKKGLNLEKSSICQT